MKNLEKVSIISVLAVSLVFSFSVLNVALAASPSLGAAATYGVLGGTYNNTNPTTVNGDVGFTTGPGVVVPAGVHTNYGAGAPTPQARIDAADALNTLNTLPCPPGNNLGAIVDLSLVHGGVYTPGVYCSTGAMSIGGGGITLSGNGTYVFRADGTLHIVTGSSITLDPLAPPSACDVFWTPTAATTFDANTDFIGTILDNANAITVGGSTTWLGRALSLGAGVVSTDTDTITTPTCVSTSSGGSQTRVIPPLISVTKVPTPLALPSGPGLVTYDYEVRNIGAVVLNNVTVTDNQCSPVEFISGNNNNDVLLDNGEIWKYSCTKTLSQTTTNTVTATGQANGLTAVDTANATVVVGVPLIPPLIHVVKVPNVFILPAGGGAVTYMYTVTNLGTEPLHNVSIVDNKCTGLPGRVLEHPGDLNKNDLLESNEAWSFTCQTNLTQTITNTATATGSANGFTATDVAFATVVVAAPTPSLPKTGFPPEEKNTMLPAIIFSGISLFSIFLYFARKKQTT